VIELAPELKTELIDNLGKALLAESPDPVEIESQLRRRGRFSEEQARDLIKQTVLQINRSLFPPVAKLEIIHTEGCNLACTYCFERDMLGPRRMSRDVALAAVDLLFDYSGDEEKIYITHFGGEPTINFSAIQSVTEHAERKAADTGKQLELHMTSNGVLFTDEMVKYFADHGIMVLLSIDGLRESHDRFRVDRRGRGTFDRVMEGFHRLKATQNWVGIKMTVMPENAPNLFDDVVGLHALGVNQFLIDYATGIKWSAADRDVYGEQLSKVFHWYHERPRPDLKIHDFDEPPGQSGFFGCQAGRNSITVSVNGEISPCSKILALNNKQLLSKLGDVRYGLTNLRNRMELVGCDTLVSACEQQGIAQSYRGGCFATNFEDNEDLFQPSLQDFEFSVMKRKVCSGCAGCGH